MLYFFCVAPHLKFNFNLIESEVNVMADSKFKGFVIFRAWVTNPKTGKRLYARDYGKRAWPIYIPVGKKKK
jgi:hypothetical protein